MQLNTIDKAVFRQVLGKYVTGVTVVTTCDAAGKWYGVTANSFTSVSMDPPLILWSLSQSSTSYAAFQSARYFAVNILGTEQQDISNRFARSSDSKFEGVDVQLNAHGVPLIDGSVAHLECQVAQCYAGGDHTIFLGQVDHLASSDRKPLAFYAGKYLRAAEESLLPL